MDKFVIITIILRVKIINYIHDLFINGNLLYEHAGILARFNKEHWSEFLKYIYINLIHIDESETNTVNLLSEAYYK